MREPAAMAPSTIIWRTVFATSSLMFPRCKEFVNCILYTINNPASTTQRQKRHLYVRDLAGTLEVPEARLI